MLTLYKPFSAMTPWRNLADDIWKGWESPAWPRFEVNEEDARFVVTAEVPGMKPGEVTVKLEGNALIIEATHEERKEEEGRSYSRVGSFRRLFQVPSAVNAEAIEAQMADGLLTIFLPKTELAAGRQVPIRTLEGAPEEPVAVEAPKAEKAAPAEKAPKAPKGKAA